MCDLQQGLLLPSPHATLPQLSKVLVPCASPGWVHHRQLWSQDLALQSHEEEHQGQTPTPELSKVTEMECREKAVPQQQQVTASHAHSSD